MDGPWWLVVLAAVWCIYYGWRAYLYHRYPVDDKFTED